MSPLWPSPEQALWPEADMLGAGGVPAGTKVTVRRRPSVTRPGSTRPTLGSWEQATDHTVAGVGLDRTSSTTLSNEGGDDELESATLWGPTAADIVRGDRVIFPNGIVVTVVSIPNRQPNMINGWRPPMSCRVEVTHG